MMTRRATLPPRTLVGPWLALPAAVLELANFLQRGMPWRGEGLWTVEWAAIVLFVLAPLCAGVAAVDACLLSRPGNVHLVVATPWPSRAYLRAAAWCAGPVIATHLVAVTLAVVLGGVREPGVGWAALAAGLAVQVLAIGWFAALGSAIGRVAGPPVVAGLVGFGVGFAASIALGDAASGTTFRLLALGAATVSRIGYAYDPWYLLPQAALLAVTAALLLLLPLRLRGALRVPTGAGVAVTVAVAVLLTAPAPRLPARRLLERPAPPTVCSGTAPRICVFAEHRRFADAVQGNVRRLTAAAAAAGYDALVPREVLEQSRTFAPGGPGVRAFSPTAEMYETGRLSVSETAVMLVTPVHCPQLGSVSVAPEDDDRYLSRLFSVTETWLRLVGVRSPGPVWTFPVDDRLTPAEVRDVVDDFARCDVYGRE